MKPWDSLINKSTDQFGGSFYSSSKEREKAQSFARDQAAQRSQRLASMKTTIAAGGYSPNEELVLKQAMEKGIF